MQNKIPQTPPTPPTTKGKSYTEARMVFGHDFRDWLQLVNPSFDEAVRGEVMDFMIGLCRISGGANSINYLGCAIKVQEAILTGFFKTGRVAPEDMDSLKGFLGTNCIIVFYERDNALAVVIDLLPKLMMPPPNICIMSSDKLLTLH